MDLTEEAAGLFKTLFPLHRSLTGRGVRETLGILQNVVPFDMKETPSGTRVYDWIVPDEWEIESAFIADSSGKILVDLKDSNLHVVNYSIPVDAVMTYSELLPHLHSLPMNPSAIPYRTSYYVRNWGFCLAHEQLEQIDKNGRFRVVIRSGFKKGSMTRGERILPGTSGSEYLISTYCCHPSLANDNLSGPILWSLLLREMEKLDLRNTYRFTIIPETIGAIVYLHENSEAMKKVKGAFVLGNVAGPAGFSWKQTFEQCSVIDRAVEQAFAEYNLEYTTYPFDLHGSDERQYSSPHWRIPTASIHRSKYYEFNEYHTSLDNLTFVRPEHLVETLHLYLSVIGILEKNAAYSSLMPYCEPFLSSRDMYPSIGGSINQRKVSEEKDQLRRVYSIAGRERLTGSEIKSLMSVMFYSDGVTDLLSIAEKTAMPFYQLADAAAKLEAYQLLKKVENV